jgi:menaquinone-dependent protoporphyrinogen oxidase
MKTAIIYVSKHGTTEKVARMIAGKLGSREVSFFNLKTDKNPDITPFDAVILGTPVYAGSPSKRMQAVLGRLLRMINKQYIRVKIKE